ncbi:MAG: C_GCAxxG_C_C family protein [Armatimonadetes bacterium]|nr:C_GCAxxG_C_C family protein [Armatimonadota bacterium]
MDNRPAAEIASEMFAQKLNCTESVLTGLVREFDLDCSCAPRIATAFGGGIAGQGETCGALTGAMMALGLKFGREQGDDNDSKAIAYGKVRQLFSEFEKVFGTCRCFDLIGIDLTTPEGLEKAFEINLHENICPDFVRFAAEAAAKLMTQKSNF